jgi:hypothetical protein
MQNPFHPITHPARREVTYRRVFLRGAGEGDGCRKVGATCLDEVGRMLDGARLRPAAAYPSVGRVDQF